MPRPAQFPPPVYERRGRAYARVYDGKGRPKDYPLGPAGTEEAKAAYVRLQADLLAGRDPQQGRGCSPPTLHPQTLASSLTVADALARFADHADRRYADSKELWHFRRVLGELRPLFGHLPLADFGPRQLTALKAHLVTLGWCRRTTNHALGRVKTAWRWLEAEGLTPRGTWDSLRAVRGAEYGEAKDYEEVLPVPEADLDATLPCLSPVVRAAVLTQLHSGARPSEVLGLRPCDLQRGGSVQLAPGLVTPLGGVWAAVLSKHKTMRHGRRRVLLFGPAAQAAMTPLLDRPPEAFLFSPRESYLWYCSQHGKRPNLNRRSRVPAERYRPDTFLQAIQYGCKRAGVPPFTAYRLRHSSATRLVAEFGWDVARIILGHSDVQMTRIYALDDLAKAAEAMRRVG